ncbi:MAG: GNAT family N-acetyltransferase, partial [Bacteroidota bacterium]
IIDYFFEKIYMPENTMLVIADGEIVSMVSMLPASLAMPDHTIHPCSYLYAFSTHPDKRGRGYGTAAMRAIIDYLFSNNVEIITLCPACNALIKFYNSAFGFMEAFYINETTIAKGRISKLPKDTVITAVSAENYNKLRNKMLRGKPHIRFADHAISFQKTLSQAANADIYELNIGNIKGCAGAEYIASNEVLVKELLLPDRYLHIGILLLSSVLPADKYLIRTPPYLRVENSSRQVVFGMILCKRPALRDKMFQKMKGYFGFAYD